MKIEFKVLPFLLPYSSYSISPAIYSFVREEWPPVSEKFVPVLLTAVTLSCLPKSSPDPICSQKGIMSTFLEKTYHSGELGPFPTLQREGLNLPKPIREVSLFSCPVIVLGMTLTDSLLTNNTWKKAAMWPLGKVSSEIKRTHGRKCSSVLLYAVVSQQSLNCFSQCRPWEESTVSNMAA